MAVVLADFVSWANVSNNTSAAQAFDAASAMIAEISLEAYKEIPEVEQDRWILELAHTLYKRKDSPGAASQGVEFGTGQPVMGPRDPLTQLWPSIGRYVLQF